MKTLAYNESDLWNSNEASSLNCNVRYYEKVPFFLLLVQDLRIPEHRLTNLRDV